MRRHELSPILVCDECEKRSAFGVSDALTQGWEIKHEEFNLVHATCSYCKVIPPKREPTVFSRIHEWLFN